jgi:hypothetical protein
MAGTVRNLASLKPVPPSTHTEIYLLISSVADPDHFDADPDPDPYPTSEKNRMRIRFPDPDPITLYIKLCNKIFLLKNCL